MKDRDRVFIKIPAGKSLKERFEQVDPLTWHKGAPVTFYTWDSGSRQHKPILGNEGLFKGGVDPAELLELWAGLTDQVDFYAAGQTGASASFISDTQAVMAEITKLITHVAGGQIGAATEALHNIGYGLVQAVAFATTELSRLETQATRQAQLAEAMVDIVAGQDERTQAEGVLLADKIDQALRASITLQGYETELDELIERLEPKSRAWRAFSEEGPVWLQERLDQLAHRETGFCALASRYLYTPADPDAAEAMANAVTDARMQVQVIEERIAVAKAEQVNVKASTEARLEQQFGVDALIRTIRDCRKAVNKASGKGVDAFSVVSGLITFDEYHKWQEMSRNPSWQSLHAVQGRLRDKADIVREFFEHEPKLSDAGQAVLKRTNHYIEKLEIELAEFGLELDEAEAHEVELQSAGNAQQADGSEPRLAHDRLEEIYEMMLAIGAVKYCGPEPLRLGTPGKMLKILQWLGRITEPEMELYSQRLEKRLDDDSFFVDLGEDRLAAWQETEPGDAHWIKVRQHRGRSTERYPMWKLVEQARDKGLSLGMHYGLDPLDVKKASDALKARKP